MPREPLPVPGAEGSPLEAVDERILHFFPELVGDLGGDPRALFDQVGVASSGVTNEAAGATYRQLVELLALAATRLDCSDFGMRLARRQAGRIRSPLFALMESCATVGEALRLASSRSHAHSPVAAIWLEPCVERREVLVGHDILLDGLPQRTQAMEQILLIAHLCIRAIAGGRVRARRVLFRHQPISPPALYRRHFGCEAAFGQRADALVFRLQDLACPTLKPDRDALAATMAHIDSGRFPRSPLHADVRGVIMHALGAQPCGSVDVARRLGLQVRTMHRQLAGEGTSFQRIKTHVRCDLALYLLRETDLEMGYISEQLGFAEQSALTYFCRKWLDSSPREIRARAPSAHQVSVRNEQV